MKSALILTLPDWHGAGPDHWLSRWELLHGPQRLEQHDWQRPLRGDWSARLQETVIDSPRPVVLVAHGLGCILAAWWAAHSGQAHRVQAALLVQTIGGLVWAGGAAARIATLEQRVGEQRLVAERLARLEEQGVATRAAVERIERRLEDRS